MKKLLALILAVTALLTVVSAQECDHDFLAMANLTSHYEECQKCFELRNAASHTFKDGKCIICGHEELVAPSEDKAAGEHEHKLMKMANLACHYEECTVCFELFNVGDHTFENGKCTVCGHKEYINPFEDVKKDAWYHDEVVKAVDTGIINGKTETQFKPDDLLTYAEAVKLAACMNQVYKDGKVTLSNGNPWYQPYVDYCRKNNIISKEYKYTDNATRAGYMEIFAEALPDEAFKDINKIADGSILDVKDSAPYAIYVYKLYRSGIVTGVDDEHRCNPEASIKRSEVAVIIARMMNEEQRVKFSLGVDGEQLAEPDKVEITHEKEAVVVDHFHKYAKKYDEDFHWDECTECEEIVDEEDHDFTDGVCEECGYKKDGNGAQAQYKEEEHDFDFSDKHDSIIVNTTKKVDYDANNDDFILSILTIYKQPEVFEADEYGEEYEAEVQVYGGKAPYSYQWFYYTGNRNDKAKIADGDYVKNATDSTLVLSIEKENTLLGRQIYCEITDSEGAKVTTNKIKVYGPFSMPVDQSLSDEGKYTLSGRVADGTLEKGEKVSVIRNGKVIAIGTAYDLQMFGKSLDEASKGDSVGIVFNSEDGVRPKDGDIVVKYQSSHKIDTSDIVN